MIHIHTRSFMNVLTAIIRVMQEQGSDKLPESVGEQQENR